MAFLKITSTNDKLSYILEKNPARGLVAKKNRQGFLCGYFPLRSNVTVETEYCIYFKDASDVVSYKLTKDEQFEYLSSSKYNDARFINDAIQELLHSARENKHDYLKSGQDYDTPALHTFMVNLVATDFKTIDIFTREFKNIKIDWIEVSKDNYHITFWNVEPVTFHYFINLINLFGIFAVLNSKASVYLDEALIEKYLKILNRTDAPYFIRYLFKVRLLRAETKYEKNVKQLEQSNLYKIKMAFGDTHAMRIAYVQENMPMDKPIVDIGTGIDFRYMKKLADKLQKQGLNYYAIERDNEARNKIEAVAANRGWANVSVFESLEDFLLIYEGEPVNVLCTEVLEHNAIKEARKLMKTVIDKINYSVFIITVPNADFNKYYGLGHFRHDDHKWEYGSDEWNKFINDNFSDVPAKMMGVGDFVEDIAVSHGLIFSK